MSFDGARVLITGGAGLVGSNLARRLVHEGASVSLVDNLHSECGGNLFNLEDIRDRVALEIGDAGDPAVIGALVYNQDFVFSLAAQTSHAGSMADPLGDLVSNARAPLTLLEACRHRNPDARVVFTSTRQVYGKPEYLPLDEAHPLAPIDVNGIHKRAAEDYHALYHRVHGIRTTTLRLTNTYGPGLRVRDARQMFLGIWIRLALERKPVRVFGDGTQRRDFNHVDDVVDALLRAAREDAAIGRVYNLGAAEVLSLREVAGLLKEQTGCVVEYVPFPPERKAIDIGDGYSDHSRARADLGWQPVVAFADGLGRTLDHYRAHAAHYWEAEPA